MYDYIFDIFFARFWWVVLSKLFITPSFSAFLVCNRTAGGCESVLERVNNTALSLEVWEVHTCCKVSTPNNSCWPFPFNDQSIPDGIRCLFHISMSLNWRHYLQWNVACPIASSFVSEAKWRPWRTESLPLGYR